jgi:hypothetical protein
MKSKFILFALVLAGIAAGLGWRQAQLANEAETALATLRHKRTAATASATIVSPRLATAKRETAALRATLAKLNAAKTRATTPLPVAAPVKNQENVTIADRLRKEPDTQLFFLARQRADTFAKYGLLFRQLQLTPEQIEAFQDTVVKHEEQMMDLSAVAETQGFSQDSSESRKLREKIDAEFQAAQHELLGPARYAQFQDYERTTFIRELVNGWAGGATVVAREPLTPEQGEQLVHILANASANYRKGQGAAPNDLDWNTVDAEAAKILTPAQFVVFKTMEPPLPVGGRFQVQMYQLVDRAVKEERTAKPVTAKPAS